jgi:hypothetical protein
VADVLRPNVRAAAVADIRPNVRADTADPDRSAAVADVLRPSVGADAADHNGSAALAGLGPRVRADATTGDGAYACRARAGPA